MLYFIYGDIMKKLLFLILLLIPFSVSAELYKVSDLTIDLDPNKWITLTRDNLEGNPDLDKVGVTELKMNDIFESNNIYLDSSYFDSINPAHNLEIIIAMKEVNIKYNLHKFRWYDLNKLEREMIKDFEVTDHGKYEINNYKYLYMTYVDNEMHVYDYYTIINGKGYTIKFQKFDEFTEKELLEFKAIINNIKFNIDPTYEKTPPMPILLKAFIYAFIGAVIASTVVLLERRKLIKRLNKE